jgi:signal transduction histidine kinase
MREIRSSAAYRIAFTYSAAFALAIVLLGVAVYFAADAEFRQQQDASIADETAELVHAYASEGPAELHEMIAEREAGGVNAFGYALFDAQGRRIVGSLWTTRPAAGWQNIVFIDPEEGPDPARALATVLPGRQTLVVAVDPEAVERIDRIILILFGGAFLFVILLGGGGALLLGGYLRRRLGRISGTAQAIVAGDLTRRMPVGARGDEFDALADSLNAMLDRIAQLMDNLHQVSSDVAHDLRTPLARLRGSLEAALEGGNDGAALQRALAQSDELLSLFAAILRISEVEGGAIGQSFGPVDVTSLAADLCETYAPAVADGGRSLVWRLDAGIVVRGDRELLAQALINLLDNAQAHTPPGTQMTVTVDADATHACLGVADNGPGVAVEDRDRIVRRFVRLESSRTTPGNGLGLNLVSAIAAAHGGTLEIADNAPGLCATIVLPKVAA